MAKTLFYEERYGTFTKKRRKMLGSRKSLIKSKIKITEEELILEPKKQLDPVIIPLNEIEDVIKEELGYYARWFSSTIFLKDGTTIYIVFWSTLWGGMWKPNLNSEFFSTLKVQLDKIKDQASLKQLEKIAKPANIFYINIEPKTRFATLICPSCQAPLEYMPPCKCEHCGVMTELMKKLSKFKK